jgi:hypothetical protein
LPDVNEITDQLPTDIGALQALLAAARAERDGAIARYDAAIAERDQALSQMDRLRHLLRQLQRAQFGRRSEKLDPEQLLFWRSRISSRPSPATKPPRTSRTRRAHAGAPTSAAATAARFPRICRMSTSRSRRKTPTAPVAARPCM